MRRELKAAKREFEKLQKHIERLQTKVREANGAKLVEI